MELLWCMNEKYGNKENQLKSHRSTKGPNLGIAILYGWETCKFKKSIEKSEWSTERPMLGIARRYSCEAWKLRKSIEKSQRD